MPSGRCSATSGTVSPSPFGYCSVITTGIPMASAPSISVAVAFAIRSKSGIALRKASWTSTTTSAVRSASSLPRQEATPMAKERCRKATWPAATVIRTRPVSSRPAKQLL